MRFKITRSSRDNPTKPPLPGAVDEPETRVVAVWQDSPYFYRTAEGKIARLPGHLIEKEEVFHHWYLDVPDLDALVALCQMVTQEENFYPYGGLLLTPEGIEIYDNYRE